ncbi:hypothetical protein L208DRAFT_1382831 [Tricholoma matsutake]|nr:hypothetical protein L208DRAFT_1382831 [Tricholoma matsutake 945]
MTMPSIVAVPAVPAVSTPIATNSAASSATTMPNTTVEPFSRMPLPRTPAVSAASPPIAFELCILSNVCAYPDMTTDAPMIATSNTLPPNGIEANTMITKKKLAIKKCTMKFKYTKESMCLRLDAGKFEHHWDGLPEEEKQKYIKQSKQLKHAASSR